MPKKWIPAGKKQPPKSKTVLIALEGGTVTTGQIVPGFGWYFNEEDDEDPADATITHWMPLPAHPETD